MEASGKSRFNFFRKWRVDAVGFPGHGYYELSSLLSPYPTVASYMCILAIHCRILLMDECGMLRTLQFRRNKKFVS